MGIFGRGRSEREPRGGGRPDVGQLLLEGQDMIEQTAAAHRRRWGLGRAERWELDQASGVLRWTFPDKVVEAPAQVIGLHATADSRWSWAWSTPLVPPALAKASAEVRAWGERHRQDFLVRPDLTLSEEQVADLVAVAFRLSRATGLYRGASDPLTAHLMFGDVTIRPHGGEPEAFQIRID